MAAPHRVIAAFRRMPRHRQAILATALALAVGGGAMVASAGYIHAKAAVAQLLLRDAWRRTARGEGRVKPWPWADTWPVARLRVPAHGEDLIVLAGASGQALAFGPGHVSQTPLPGYSGNSVIGGHRDTNFRFLAQLRPGDRLEVETAGARAVAYRVIAAEIVDSRRPWYPDRPPAGGRLLTLVTCYPFDAVNPGGPLRYVVVAEAAAAGIR